MLLMDMCPIVPTWMLHNLHTPSQIAWNSFHDLFILLLSPDLSTVREFLLKQTQLKCFKFGRLTKHTNKGEDVIVDTVKVLKCYSGIAT